MPESSSVKPIKSKPKRPKQPVVYAFIDSQNLNLGVQRAGWKMDWKRFRKYLKETHNVTNAYMFIGYLPENEAMYEQLHDSGYLIVLKPTIETVIAMNPDLQKNEKKDVNPENKPAVKGNIDAELVLYAMKEFPNYNKAIIVSGDGDFYCLAEYLASKKRLLHIMTPNWRYSTLLKPYEKYIVRIDQLRQKLEHKDRRFKKSSSSPETDQSSQKN